MAKKKKKKSQAFTMIILFLVIIVLVIVYIVAGRIAKEADKEGTVIEDKKLIQIDTSKAKTLTYTIDGTEYTLVNEEGTWKVESEKERPLDQDKVWDMVNRFQEMTANKEVSENQDKLGDMGLDKPSLKVVLKLEDGATYSYSTGTTVVTSDGGCYATVQGFPGIYVLPSGYHDLFSVDLNSITQLATVDGVDANNITKIRITKDSNILIDVAMNKDTEEWVITKPYASSVKMDASSTRDLASKYVNYRFTENVDYNCKDFSKYGLESPTSEVYLEYFTKGSDADTSIDHKLKLSIGNKNEDGSLYYVRLNDSDSVYTMEANEVSAYTTVNAFDYVRSSMFSANVNDLTKATVVANGKTYDIQMLKDNYKINGIEKNASEIGIFYGKLTLIKIMSEVKKEVNTTKPVCSISVTDANNVINYSFFEYDSNYYAMQYEGHTYFLVDKNSVDDMVHLLENQ